MEDAVQSGAGQIGQMRIVPGVFYAHDGTDFVIQPEIPAIIQECVVIRDDCVSL